MQQRWAGRNRETSTRNTHRPFPSLSSRALCRRMTRATRHAHWTQHLECLSCCPHDEPMTPHLHPTRSRWHVSKRPHLLSVRPRGWQRQHVREQPPIAPPSSVLSVRVPLPAHTCTQSQGALVRELLRAACRGARRRRAARHQGRSK